MKQLFLQHDPEVRHGAQQGIGLNFKSNSAESLLLAECCLEIGDCEIPHESIILDYHIQRVYKYWMKRIIRIYIALLNMYQSK